MMRRWILVLGSILFTFVLSELTARAYFSLRVGPRVLFYGTPFHRQVETADAAELRTRKEMSKDELAGRTLWKHKNDAEGYIKYFPNETKFEIDVNTGERFEVTINSDGFRGPDYAPEPPQGTLRVITLGGSSTFGYYNRDHDTYPAQMQVMLNERCASIQFEVVNLGIPHMKSDQIAAILTHEGLRLNPSVVTFYEGRNNTAGKMPKMNSKPGASGSKSKDDNTDTDEFTLFGADRFLLVKFAESLITSMSEDAFPGLPEDVEGFFSERSEEFIQDVAGIASTCEENEILFIPSTQQGTASRFQAVSAEGRALLKGITFEQEVKSIKEHWLAGNRVTKNEMRFLLHDKLQSDLKEWVLKEGLPLVDIIEVLDNDRHLLLSWVHLNAQANTMVADAFAEEILERKCERRGD